MNNHLVKIKTSVWLNEKEGKELKIALSIEKKSGEWEVRTIYKDDSE